MRFIDFSKIIILAIATVRKTMGYSECDSIGVPAKSVHEKTAQ